MKNTARTTVSRTATLWSCWSWFDIGVEWSELAAFCHCQTLLSRVELWQHVESGTRPLNTATHPQHELLHQPQRTRPVCLGRTGLLFGQFAICFSEFLWKHQLARYICEHSRLVTDVGRRTLRLDNAMTYDVSRTHHVLATGVFWTSSVELSTCVITE